ncbi:MAG: CAP domain-containing protein [Gemmataceae bacterium]|nr:CAP domain-containing protein [Gemmataceae bacterium]MDW8265198.1 CAP domain-containing protein [Gemmataceae bacterium]
MAFRCLIALFGVAAVLGSGGGARPAADSEEDKALAVLNAARKACGLNEVTLSPKLSDGCRKHARYLLLNRGKAEVEGLKAHEEQPSLPGHTPEGAKAAKAAVIHYRPPQEAVVDWLATFYHRIPLLQPTLTEVGIGWAKEGDDWVVLIDCISGSRGPRTRDVVFYPDDQQTVVPRRFGMEIPSPLPAGHRGPAGFPITVFFAAGQSVKAVTFSLHDEHDQPIPVYLSTPEAPASSWVQWNTVCAIPRQPLPAATTCTAAIKATVDGRAFSRTWRFRTTKLAD